MTNSSYDEICNRINAAWVERLEQEIEEMEARVSRIPRATWTLWCPCPACSARNELVSCFKSKYSGPGETGADELFRQAIKSEPDELWTECAACGKHFAFKMKR